MNLIHTLTLETPLDLAYIHTVVHNGKAHHQQRGRVEVGKLQKWRAVLVALERKRTA